LAAALFWSFIYVAVTSTIQHQWAGKSSKGDAFGFVCVFEAAWMAVVALCN
jgi:hypothetical protein